jgi:hypothetical protein
MNKAKSPQEKKQLSLERDRRSIYGENDKASRKLVPRRKQLSRMAQRREVSQVLSGVRGHIDEETGDSIQSQVHVKIAKTKLKSFRKRPDVPLREFLARRDKRPINS